MERRMKAGSMIKHFIRKNLPWLTTLILVTGLHLFYLFLLGVSGWEILYSGILDGCIVLAATVFIFLLYRKKVATLDTVLQQTLPDRMQLPEPSDDIERIYEELLDKVSEERLKAVSSIERQQSEMQDYYSRWVHQIKTPISAMQLLLQTERNRLEEILSQEESAPEATEHSEYLSRLDELADMEEELFSIEQYVNMALQYQRIQSDENDYVLEKVSLDEVIRNAIHKYARLMIRKKIRMHYEGTGQVVFSDTKWLTFVVEQILSNAVKYTQEGGIFVDVAADETAGMAAIRVTDQGIGIRPEDIPRVFERGYTGFNGHANQKSTGIGLYLCKQVLQKLGHTISIESVVGEGTTVSIICTTGRTDFRD